MNGFTVCGKTKTMLIGETYSTIVGKDNKWENHPYTISFKGEILSIITMVTNNKVYQNY